jgi:hypothetical protein
MTELTESETDIDLPDGPLPPSHRVHPQETWDLARADYLAGLSGPAVCARYGLGLAALRKRAAAGGWRRIDYPRPMPVMPIEVDGDIDEASYLDLALMAEMHLRDAIINGRATEAATWMRIHFRILEADDPVPFDDPEPGAEALGEVDGVDEVHRVFSAPESTVSSRTRPRPETPAPPASTPAPGPGCGAESARTGR